MSHAKQVRPERKPFPTVLRNYTAGFLLVISAGFVVGLLRENYADIVAFFGSISDSFVSAFRAIDSPWTLVSVGGACAFGIGVLLLGGCHFYKQMSKFSLVVLACLISILFLVWGGADHALMTNHPEFFSSSGFAEIASVMMKAYIVFPGMTVIWFTFSSSPLVINWVMGAEATQHKPSDASLSGKSS